MQSAETALGRARHRQPDWVLDSVSTLETALGHSNDLLPLLSRLQVSRRS